ncbi:hypothetical protein P8629_06565 [Hydrogenovibrio sp. 3SP14C1]|uniref:hypothetical protein n=1 Tax=Hydrogenovibrio sp. 3SP14C1 TaxID=3038774 RepID=UPI002416E34F|nr:hypothetical protein [Hydrogenovibrio sp. 3SP14C1]MDG4812667.1 hypothetical protein [Hydrogenovibrio sp. 3SP14C1]
MTFQFIQQTEQPNHYWLVEMEQDNTQPAPINLQLTVDGVALQLFAQQQSRLQFLTTQAVSLSPGSQINSPKNSQAWLFLNDIVKALSKEKPILILASGIKIATAFYLSKALSKDFDIRVILHAENAFPFQIKPARFMFANFPAYAIGASTLLEDWKIPNRLCCDAFLPGSYEGNFSDLFSGWSPPSDWQTIDCHQLDF